MRKKDNLLLFVVLGLLLIFGFYCAWGKKSDSDGYSNGDDGVERKKISNNIKKVKKSSPPDIEFIGGSSDGRQEIESDSFELLGVANEEPAHTIGFGIGPGIYGSGRNTSEMLG